MMIISRGDARLAHPGEELEAVDLGHAQVGENEGVAALLDHLPGGLAVGGHLHLEAVVGEEHLQALGDVASRRRRSESSLAFTALDRWVSAQRARGDPKMTRRAEATRGARSTSRRGYRAAPGRISAGADGRGRERVRSDSAPPGGAASDACPPRLSARRGRATASSALAGVERRVRRADARGEPSIRSRGTSADDSVRTLQRAARRGGVEGGEEELQDELPRGAAREVARGPVRREGS